MFNSKLFSKMINLILSLAGLFVAGVAWVTSDKNTKMSNNNVAYEDEGNRSGNSKDNFLDFSGGLLGI